MERKKKIMAVLAAGAIALCVGSGVARCAIAPQEEPGDQQQEQKQEASQESPQGEAEAQGGFADLENTSWTSEDGKSTLSITKGTLIEKAKKKDPSVLYFTVCDETRDGNTLSATLSVSKSMTGEEEQTVALVRSSADGGLTLVCDKLSSKYIKDAPAETKVELAGVTDDLANAFGKDEGAFASVVEGFAKEKSPYATRATWSKEVWIDFGAGTYLTNFSLNDASSTIVTVQMDSSGKLAAL